MATPAPVLQLVEGGDGTIELQSLPPLIPDGIYRALCLGHETAIVFRTAKVFLQFRVVEPGEQFGKMLYRPYRASGFIRTGKGPGSGLRIKLKARSELFGMLCRVLDLPARTRPDRVGLREMKGKVFKVKTRTVTRDYRQKEIPGFLRYSVVDDVLSLEAGVAAVSR
jgi:hypothetical protein